MTQSAKSPLTARKIATRLGCMYIRESTQASKKAAKKYKTYRLVESVRTERGVRQQLLLNLGSNFAVSKESWQNLANRIEAIVTGQQALFEMEPELESIACMYAKALIKKGSSSAEAKSQVSTAPTRTDSDYHMVDINSVSNSGIATIGGEHVAYQTILQLGLDKQLKALGLNSAQVPIAIGTIIGRMLHPGSERNTHKWLQYKSGLGELLDFDFQHLSLDRFYKISDTLLAHKDSLEPFLYEKEKNLFNLKETIILYDLTNTYFEGTGRFNTKARFGRSKEKRSDCPLVTLALVLDGEGFPKNSSILPGNISEPKTLADTLKQFDTSTARPTIIMDAGIATADNLLYLKESGYTYIVVSRKRNPVMPEDGDKVFVRKKLGKTISVKLVKNEKGEENELYCHSEIQERKERNMEDTFCKRYEESLTELAKGLGKKGCVKKYDRVLVALGRLREKYKRVAHRYDVAVKKDKTTAASITWDKKAAPSSNGISCLRTNNLNWSESEIWKTYMLLTEIEASFRSMKSELGMRPVYHQITNRVDGHLFITVLAYHIVHSIMYQLRDHDIDYSWSTLREILAEQCRITTTMKKDDGRTINIRGTSDPTALQRKIYKALNMQPRPGKKTKTIV